MLSEGLFLHGGNRIEAVAHSAPGSLLEAGLTELRRFVEARGGLSDGEVDRLALVVVQCLRSVYSGAHPQNEVGIRNRSEMELMA